MTDRRDSRTEDVQFDFRFTSDISPESQAHTNSLVLGLRILRMIVENHTLNIRFS